jgi:MoxR-like ATPase
MTPSELRQFLDRLVGNRLYLSTMLWGPPGIGKSSIVAQVAESAGMELVDVRLSQLAPTDLRGLPVPENGRARWFPPEFLPNEGRGILFLDELNMAPPAVQGIAQQLILDRKVGSYSVPDGWFIWAAGNRKEDRAAVFEMPAPLANRFLHLFVTPDFDSWKGHALTQGMHEQVIAFLNFRPSLLHKQDPSHPAWPSPRSWEMASRLHEVGLDIAPVVGEGAAAEFEAYRALYENLPDLDAITEGKGANIRFPSEPSIRYATVIGLTVRVDTVEKAVETLRWLRDRAPMEWIQLFMGDLIPLWRSRARTGELARLYQEYPDLDKLIQRDYVDVLAPSISSQ